MNHKKLLGLALVAALCGTGYLAGSSADASPSALLMADGTSIDSNVPYPDTLIYHKIYAEILDKQKDADKASEITGYIYNASKLTDVSPALIAAIMETESGFEDHSPSTEGNVGLMNLVPSMAAWTDLDIEKPSDNVLAGAMILQSFIQLNKNIDDQEEAQNCAIAGFYGGSVMAANYPGMKNELPEYLKQYMDAVNQHLRNLEAK